METAYKINETIAQQYNAQIVKLIQLLGAQLKQVFKAKQDRILISYKDQLLKTRQQFNKLQQLKSQQAIKKAVLQQKNTNEKECEYSLEHSLEISKTYQMMKTKLSQINGAQHELQLEIKYLQKQCQKINKKRDFLKKELNNLENFNQKENQIDNDSFIMQFGKSGIKNNLKNCNSIILSGKNTPNQLKNRQVKLITQDKNLINQNVEKNYRQTNKWDIQYENNIKNRIEQIKDYKDSVIHQQSTLESIFKEYDLNNYKTNKQKLLLIEKIFSRPDVKQQIYQLLFNE